MGTAFRSSGGHMDHCLLINIIKALFSHHYRLAFACIKLLETTP